MSLAKKEKKELLRDVLRVDNTYYDTKKLAAIHPGGDLLVLLSNQTDATILFNSSHRRRFPHDKYKAFAIPESDVAEDVRLPVFHQNFDTYFEICEKVKSILGSTGGFAPWWYFVKVFVLVAVVLSVDITTFFWARPLWLTCLQSLFMAWIGLNIQHDANHGAVSKSWWINRALGMCQDLCGGTSVAWSYNHNIIHHVHCNDVKKDHDLEIPLLRLMKRIPWHFGYQMQQFYFLFLEAIFGPVHVIQTQMWMWRGPDEKMKLATDHWNMSRLISIVIPLRFIGFALTQPTWGLVFAHAALQYCVGGLYLAFFFLISHNFTGVRKEGIDSSEGCFVQNQVETSCNVGGPFLAFMNGGLNYQIEHHLFPRVHHSFYHKLAGVVSKVCKEKKYRYCHYDTIADNFVSTFHHLEDLGKCPKAE